MLAKSACRSAQRHESKETGNAGGWAVFSSRSLSTVESLIRWGGRLIPAQRGLKDKQPRWLEVAVPALLRPKLNEKFRIQFQIEDYSFAVVSDGSHLDVIKGKTERPDLILNLNYQQTLAVLSGYVPPKSLTSDEITSTKYTSKTEAIKKLQEILR
jgi:hypothetical protein